MPFVDVTLIERRDPTVLRALLGALSDAAAATLDINADSVRVVSREVAATHWATGSATIEERRKQ
jgi:phenylpyruvate tautomerase PptA (4-oxalocrotonate tautomerase family)